ncbi:Lcl C-terminal domain-containing protein [Kaarinaea lacus]
MDNDTGLLWEVKTHDTGLQDAVQTYSWFVPHPQINGGFAGYENHGQCSLTVCNTQSYVDAINKTRLCGSNRWRLPTREELRSIVDYQVKYPGPTVNQKYFPNTQSQFYWSSVPDANDKDSAWGIGFSFGYDYAYFKSDLGYVRLVSDHVK